MGAPIRNARALGSPISTPIFPRASFPGKYPDLSAGKRPRRAFWILSDLGLDSDPDFSFGDPPECDAILVAGNVRASLEASLRWLAEAFDGLQGSRPVFIVPGNVEYRSRIPFEEALAEGRELAGALGFHLLSDDAVRFGPADGSGTVVIGATLWTDWCLRPPAEVSSARVRARTAWEDAGEIPAGPDRYMTPLDSLAHHARSRAFIEDALTSVVIQSLGLGVGVNACIDCAKPGDVAVVLTCHSPTPLSLPADWDGWRDGGCLAASRASEAALAMTAWGAPVLWAHGNVPRAVDHRLGRTRVVANPRIGDCGYADFDPALVVSV